LGLFDRVFRKAESPPDPSASIKVKYEPVLQLLEREGVRVLNLHVEGGRLYVKGAAPSEEARRRILAAIRAITPGDDDDIVADISVG
jgi:rRNA pseudouridine-1189 N-methylase Emg1 (Nep1/Mra1 family)